MTYPLKQSSTAQPLVFLMVDSTDHVTGKTGLSPTVTISKAGGSFASPSGSVSEVANGFYKVAGNATDTNTLGPLALHATATGADPTDVVYWVTAIDPQVTPPTAATVATAVWDELHSAHTTSGTYGQSLKPLRSATAQAGAAASITLDSSANANDDYYTNSILYIVAGTGAGQSRIIEDYVGSTKVASISPNWTTTPDNTSVFCIAPLGSIPGATAPSASTVASAVWEELRASHTTSGSFGEGVKVNGYTTAGKAEVQAEAEDALVAKGLDHLVSASVTGTDITDNSIIAKMVSKSATADWDSFTNTTDSLEALADAGASATGVSASDSGTAQAGAAGTITLRSAASSTNDIYNGQTVQITGGTGAGQRRLIYDYVGSTRVASITPDWITTPDNTSTYKVWPFASVLDVDTADIAGSGSLGVYLVDQLGLISSETTLDANGLVSNGSIYTVYQGETINSTSANQIRLTVSHSSINLTGFTPKFGITKLTSNSGTSTLSVSGTVNSAGVAGQNVTFALTSVQTAALALDTTVTHAYRLDPASVYAYRWTISATDGSSNCPTLAQGYLSVKSRDTSC